jgi:ABC-type sugar transport system ATPase subunit
VVTAETEYGPVLIEADAITKRFGGAVAVDDVSISVRAGEIYGLVGENGAGKSTLMRVLAGILSPDQGEVRVDGKPVPHGARAAISAGISLVHQELSLVPEMTVAENILLGAFPTKVGFTEYQKLRQIAADALAEIGVGVDLDERVGRLSVALRQFVEIARAVAKKPRILIFDEPTATLTPAETDYLLAMLRRLADGGMAIIYISHRLPEIFSTCSTVAILRDGKLVLTSPIDGLTPSQVVDQMVGRELGLDLASERTANPGAVVLDAQGITAPKVNNVSVQVRAGEIVGLGGLVGAGRSELVRAIIGADDRTAGRVTLTHNGKTVTVGSYQSAVRNGVAYVPEERRIDGLALSMTVEGNIRLPNRKELSVAGFKIGGKTAQFAQLLADKVGLRPPEIRRDVGEYSGGNQQKVVLAKWLGRRPEFIVLDEPTRGVDVGAKAEIHRLVKEIADQGTAVLIVSSDLPELLELSDTIHVMRDGRVTGTLSREEASEKSVMSLASGEAIVRSS